MRPIVDGLEAEFGDNVHFVFANALDSAEGQQAFKQTGLPGHPSYVIYDADGAEVYRTFGVVPRETLAAAVGDALSAAAEAG